MYNHLVRPVTRLYTSAAAAAVDAAELAAVAEVSRLADMLEAEAIVAEARVREAKAMELKGDRAWIYWQAHVAGVEVGVTVDVLRRVKAIAAEIPMPAVIAELVRAERAYERIVLAHRMIVTMDLRSEIDRDFPLASDDEKNRRLRQAVEYQTDWQQI